jgi:acetyltransferase-like isoleucine patch superfamily enzyme
MPVENVKGFEDCICHHPELVNLYGCDLGPGTKIGAFVEIGTGVIVGCDCKIQTGAFIPEGVEIGDEVFIGPHACFTNVKHVFPAKEASAYQKTIIRDQAVIGAGAVILPGVYIGFGAVIGAGAVVTNDVSGLETVVGNPARVLEK